MDVLEIGVGLGADHQRFAQAGARLTGIDLTARAVEHTDRRFKLLGLKSDLRVADAESMPFPDESYDRVYSWGVLHHSPNTAGASRRSGGCCDAGDGQDHDLPQALAGGLHALAALWAATGKPWRSLSDIYAHHLESPGTKAYTVDEARALFSNFAEVKISTVLTHGDYWNRMRGNAIGAGYYRQQNVSGRASSYAAHYLGMICSC